MRCAWSIGGVWLLLGLWGCFDGSGECAVDDVGTTKCDDRLETSVWTCTLTSDGTARWEPTQDCGTEQCVTQGEAAWCPASVRQCDVIDATIPCVHASGCEGLQTCLDDFTWSMCVCDGTPPPPTAPPPPVTPPDTTASDAGTPDEDAGAEDAG